MHLYVDRVWLSDKSVIGELSFEGVFFCYTLEPPVKFDGSKPRCTPDGTYKVTLEKSSRFQIITPHVQDVPGFEGIEIHPGNYPKDTLGCTLVGRQKGVDAIFNSRDAFDALMTKITGQETLSITYTTADPNKPETEVP